MTDLRRSGGDHHAANSSYCKHALFPRSLDLTLRACELVMRGETRERQVHHVPARQTGTIRTDLTPGNKNECFAVARTLKEQVAKLSRQTKRDVPREFTRVASDLNQ